MKRDAIVKETKEWCGTKWQHQASLKGIACDCVGLIRGVYRELTGKEIQTTMDYPATWHLFKEEERLLGECRKYAGEEIEFNDILPGDIITFSFKPRFVDHHIGIFLGDGMFAHSYLDVGKVVINRFDETWMARVRHCFRFPGVGE